MQEFNVEIPDKKGRENLVADHLSRLPPICESTESEGIPINEEFPDEKLYSVSLVAPWYADLANFKASNLVPKGWTSQQKKKFFKEAKYYVWDEPFLFKKGIDGILRRCIPESEVNSILWHCHSSPCGGHYRSERTAQKVLQSGFFWPTVYKDSKAYVTHCDQCQRIGNITMKHEGPLNTILEVEIFDV